jgi:glycine cleavage system protein P-like pyridoxal-binding family
MGLNEKLLRLQETTRNRVDKVAALTDERFAIERSRFNDKLTQKENELHKAIHESNTILRSTIEIDMSLRERSLIRHLRHLESVQWALVAGIIMLYGWLIFVNLFNQ